MRPKLRLDLEASLAKRLRGPDKVLKTNDAPPPAAGKNERVSILLVDDEPKNLDALESVLGESQHRLVRAESAEQALLALVADEFALLILDIQMPGMNGFELAQMIKQRKKTAGIPIIFLTAYYSSDEHVLEGYGTGAVDYMHKPINPAVLRSKVAVFVELHRKSRELESVNRALLSEVNARRAAQSELQRLTENLEVRVAERTAELQDAEAMIYEASRRKDEFLATLAHELRNPLAPLRNAVDILQRSNVSSEDHEWAEGVIDRQSRLMVRLVDDLLDVARITTGKLTIQRHPVALQEIISQATETSRPLIDECGVNLSSFMTPTPLLIDGDAMRLTQVVSNLLNNAAKFTPSGGSIAIDCEQDGDEAVLTVSDSGVGIAPEMLPSVFDLFAQGESSHGFVQRGLGIGLTLVKRLVELHRGSIVARSDGPGKGSSFVLRFPMTNSQPDTETTVRESKGVPPFRKLRLIVADDNVDSANALRLLLSTMGHDAEIAFDGASALEKVELLRPDAALLDIGMPNMDGYEVCRRVRSEPWGKEILLIAQTGWGQEQDRQRTRAAGFDFHLVKPVDYAELLKVLGEWRSHSKI